MYDGSGDSFAEALAGTGPRYSSMPNSTDPTRAALGALSVTTRLMKSEMLGPSTQSHGFGFSYEIILAKEHRFEYVDDILYFAVTHDMDRAGKFLGSHFRGLVYKYRSRENHSLIDVYDPSRNAHNAHIVSPVGQQSKETLNALLRSIQRSDHCYPFPSQYYCVFSQFNTPDFESPPLVMVQGNDVPQNKRMFEVTAKNELLLHVNPDMIEWMYRTIREEQAREATSRGRPTNRST